MDVIGYRRVSTAEQADSGAGLAAQAEAIQKAVDARGWRLVGFYEDAGSSGRSLTGRPQLAAALATIEAGEAQALVVAKLDRLSRSILDFVGIMDRAQKKGWAVVALDLGVDTTTPQGEVMANVMASFAQFERRLIGQRTKDALAVKRQQGVRLGRPRALQPGVARTIRRLRKGGLTLQAIAQQLNEGGVPTAQGGKQWYPGTVRKILKQV